MRADRLGDLTEHPGVRPARRGEPVPAGGDGRRRAAGRDRGPGPQRRAAARAGPGRTSSSMTSRASRARCRCCRTPCARRGSCREGRTLTVEGYRQTGGIRGAVAHSAEALYEALPAEQRGLLRTLLLRLVATTPDGEAVRTRMPRRLVAIDADHEQLVERLVDRPPGHRRRDDRRAGPRVVGPGLAAAARLARRRRQRPAHPAPPRRRRRRLGRPRPPAQRAVPRRPPRPGAGVARPGRTGSRPCRARLPRRREAAGRRRAATPLLAASPCPAPARASSTAAVAVRSPWPCVAATSPSARRPTKPATPGHGRPPRRAALVRSPSTPTIPALPLLLAVEGARLDDNADTRANLHTVLQRDGRPRADGCRPGSSPSTLAVSPADGTVAVGGADRRRPARCLVLPPRHAGPDRHAQSERRSVGPSSSFDLTARNSPSPDPHRGPISARARTVSSWSTPPPSNRRPCSWAACRPASTSTSPTAATAGTSRRASIGRSVGERDRSWSGALSTPEAPILQIDDRGQWVPGVALSPDGSRLYVWEHNDGGGPLTGLRRRQRRGRGRDRSAAAHRQRMLPAGPGDWRSAPTARPSPSPQGEDVVLYDGPGTSASAPGCRSDDGSRTWWDDVRFSHDGALLAAGGARWRRVWDVATRRAAAACPRVPSAAFGPNDATLYTTWTAAIAQWDLARDRRPRPRSSTRPTATRSSPTEPSTQPAASAAALALDAATPDGTPSSTSPALAQDPVRFLDTDRGELVEGPDAARTAPCPGAPRSSTPWPSPPPGRDGAAGRPTQRGRPRRAADAERDHGAQLHRRRRPPRSSGRATGQTRRARRRFARARSDRASIVGGSILGVYPTADGQRAAVLIGRQSGICAAAGQRYAAGRPHRRRDRRGRQPRLRPRRRRHLPRRHPAGRRRSRR